MFNGVTDLGFEALEEIHNRAVNQLFSDVLLVKIKFKTFFEMIC
jgi:hypothetical protein